MLNFDPICRGIAQGAAGAGERGGPDLSFARCLGASTRRDKAWLGRGPATPPGDRQHCVAKTMMGGLSSYTIFLNASNRRRRHTRCFLDTGRIELSKEPAPTTALRWWGASCCPIRHQRPPLSYGERFSKSASNSARLEKFDTDVMVSSPNDPARPTRVRRSGQMQSKAFRQIVNVANRQACT